MFHINLFLLRYNRDDIFVHDDEEEIRLLNTFGFYWHYFMKISEALRSINNDEGPATGEEASAKAEFKSGMIPIPRPRFGITE